jgi:HlyD family secretion protein
MLSVTSPARRAAGAVLLTGALITGCRDEAPPDAYGNFEAIEVIVSAQTSGQIEQFVPVEGMPIERGALVAVIDTSALALERAQLVAQRTAVSARRAEASEQLHVLEVQRDIARRAYDRTQRLHAVQAATAQQLDQAEREYRVLEAQIEAVRAQRTSVGLDVATNEARVAQIRDRISKSTIVNPQKGTVLTTYARAGEVIQAGQPLYRIADLDTLILRAYLTGDQLLSVRPGQEVQVTIGESPTAGRTLSGTVTWISPTAEFTPTPVQTRDERASLVYAMKIRVINPDGVLKIGMPADVTLPAGTTASKQGQ